jgi:phosphoglycolate phosphatase
VCTNKPEKLSFLLLDALDLRSYFAAVCGADTFAARKPDPSHLLGTIERAGGDVTRAIMIGDSQTDLATARAAGVPVILMSYGYTDVPADELGADRVLADFADVPAAAQDLLAREGTA